jgi:hypothetical protein
MLLFSAGTKRTKKMTALNKIFCIIMRPMHFKSQNRRLKNASKSMRWHDDGALAPYSKSVRETAQTERK